MSNLSAMMSCLHVAQDIDKARASGLDQAGRVTLVNGDVTAGAEALAEAIGNAEAVICATGFSGGGRKDVPCAAASCNTVGLRCSSKHASVSQLVTVTLCQQAHELQLRMLLAMHALVVSQLCSLYMRFCVPAER